MAALRFAITLKALGLNIMRCVHVPAVLFLVRIARIRAGETLRKPKAPGGIPFHPPFFNTMRGFLIPDYFYRAITQDSKQ